MRTDLDGWLFSEETKAELQRQLGPLLRVTLFTRRLYGPGEGGLDRYLVLIDASADARERGRGTMYVTPVFPHFMQTMDLQRPGDRADLLMLMADQVRQTAEAVLTKP